MTGLLEGFYRVFERVYDRSTEAPISQGAYLGIEAWRKLKSDEEIFRQLLVNEDMGASELIGFKLFKDFDSPQPEQIKFFIDGVHLFTLNTETNKVTEIDFDADDTAVWQLSAIAHHFGDRDRIYTNGFRGIRVRPMPSLDVSPLKDVDPNGFETMVYVSFDEMVGKGILRFDEKEDFYALTYQGRLACTAARYHSTKYQNELSRRHKSIMRKIGNL